MDKNLTIEITDEFCEMVMCTALEGGIGYWCAADKIERVSVDGMHGFDYLSFEAYDAEDPDSSFGKVTYNTIRDGVRRILTPGQGYVSGHIAEATRLDLFGGREKWGTGIDADAADVIVQVGLFNELVYG